MTLHGIEDLPDGLRNRCTSDEVTEAILTLMREVLRGDLDKADLLVEAIDDLIRARLDERQQALATAILEAAP